MAPKFIYIHKMKKLLLSTLLVSLCLSSFAQDNTEKEATGYKFTDVKRLPVTCVKSQDNTGTCWSWSTLSFFEAEMIRAGKDSVSLAPMYIVWNTYDYKAEKYVRMHGNINFAQGGAFADVLWAFRERGLMPLEAYKGLSYGEDKHRHGELEAILKAYVGAVVENENGRLSSSWRKGLDGVLDAYLGEKPNEFTFNGKKYTPRSFADNVVGLNPDDYVCLTSYTHHPFYTKFAIEVEDNWLGEFNYNLPLDELMDVLDKAIDKGYSFAWGADVSERGFSRKHGIAVSLDKKAIAKTIEGYDKMSNSEKNEAIYSLKTIQPEITVTQELRQEGFDNYETTDDHGMHIMGKAVDQNGNKYFIVKNSWGDYGDYEGYIYVSYPYVAYKTMNVMINKNALSKELRKKLGI